MTKWPMPIGFVMRQKRHVMRPLFDVLEMELRKNRFTEWHHWNMSSLTNLLVAQMHGFPRGIIG